MAPTPARGGVGGGRRGDPGFCTGCGEPSARCAGCGRPLDPPRFCPVCGRRLTVSVTPGRYRARCRQDGEVASG